MSTGQALPQVSRVAPAISRLSGGVTNFYLIEEGGKLTVVDAGTPADWGLLQRALAARGKTAGDVLARRLAFTLVLRVLMEAGIVAAFAWWGYRAGAGTGMKILLAVGAPALGFGLWGAVDFHQAGRLAEPLRLCQELAISGLAAVAVYTAGQHLLGWALGLLSAVYHALVYLQGGRLLKHRSSPPALAAPAPGAAAALPRPGPDRAGEGKPDSSRGR